MKINLGEISICILFLLACPLSIRAQQTATNRNVILRRDPSAVSPVVTHLPKGARLALVDQNPDSGFYHIRTEDDQVGWVTSKALIVSQAPLAPAPLRPQALFRRLPRTVTPACRVTSTAPHASS